MSTIKELVERNKKRRKSKAKDDVKELIESLMTTNEILYMVQEWMEHQGLDTSNTPPMFFPEALSSLIYKKMKEVGALPGIPATVRYELVEVPESDNQIANALRASDPPRYRRVELKGNDNGSVHIGVDANGAESERADDVGRQRSA